LTAFRAEAKSSGAVSAAVAKPLVRDALRAVRASIACLYIVDVVWMSDIVVVSGKSRRERK
jgi:hypothetical protein